MAETFSKSPPTDTKSKTGNGIKQESPTNTQGSNQGEVEEATSTADDESLGSQGTEKTDESEELSIGQVTLENYKVLLEALMEVKTEWYSLGTALKLDTEMLDDIKYASRVKYTEYLKELLSLWLKKGKEEATWEKLREALLNCYQKKLAAALEGKSGPVDMEVGELTTQLTKAIAVWKSLARELGVDSNLDEAINCRYCMHTMIRKWILTNQKRANVDVVIRALEKSKIESSTLVEKLRINPEIQTTYTIIPKMAATVVKD